MQAKVSLIFSDLQEALGKIDAGIQGTILLLKGLEGEKESRISRQKQKTETEGKRAC